MSIGRVVAGGGGHPEGLEAGFFVRPTVFVNVKNEMAIAQEEIFGPALCVIAYDSEEEAIRIANDSKYGLLQAAVTAVAIRGQREVRRRAFLGTRSRRPLFPDRLHTRVWRIGIQVAMGS